MKKWIGIIGILVIMLTIGLYNQRGIHMSSVLTDLLDSSENWNVVYIEELLIDGEPNILPVDNKEDGDRILDNIMDTTIQYVKNELGMEISTDLYTITIESNGNIASVTLNGNGYLHTNDDEKTYRIINNSNLYQVVQEIYKQHQK